MLEGHTDTSRANMLRDEVDALEVQRQQLPYQGWRPSDALLAKVCFTCRKQSTG